MSSTNSGAISANNATTSNTQGAIFHLQVRTLDQSTYPISVLRDATIAQLKMHVAAQTGVPVFRQRLIYRGRVLKDEHTMLSYSIEDGHTLHLVARAEPEPSNANTAASNSGSSTSQQTSNRRSRDASTRNTQPSDAPNRSVRRTGHRVMWNTTGRSNDEPDPNMSTSGLFFGPNVLMGTFEFSERRRPSAIRSGSRALATQREGRDRQLPSLLEDFLSRSVGTSNEREGRGRAAARRTNSSASSGPSIHTHGTQAHRLQNLHHQSELNLNNIRSDLDDRRYDFAPSATSEQSVPANSNVALLQSQLSEFESLQERLNVRLRRLPSVLQEFRHFEMRPQESMRPAMQAIHTLQSVGEAATLLSSFAYNLLSTPHASPSDDPSPQANTTSTSRRHTPQDATNTNVYPSHPSASNDAVPRPSRHVPLNSGTNDESTNMSGASGPQGFQMSMSGPLQSFIFPMSMRGQTSTTWEFAGFIGRVARDIPIAPLHSALAGDMSSVHALMDHVGYSILSGIDLPPVTRTEIRSWTAQLASELRRQLAARVMPQEVRRMFCNSQDTSLADMLVTPIEPFLPELVDLLLRATSATRMEAFGTNGAQFLRNMAQHFMDHVSSHFNTTEEVHLALMHLLTDAGVAEPLARVVVSSLDVRRQQVSRRRQRSQASADAPANKRRRQ